MLVRLMRMLTAESRRRYLLATLARALNRHLIHLRRQDYAFASSCVACAIASNARSRMLELDHNHCSPVLDAHELHFHEAFDMSAVDFESLG